MKRFLLPLLWVAFFCPGRVAVAQDGYSIVSYQVAFPVGSTLSFINRISARGVGLEAGWFIKPNLSAGLSASWNVFYKDVGRKTVGLENNTAVTANQYRYINAVPIYANLRYYFRQETSAFFPYIGLGLGTIYARRETDLGLYAVYEQGWQFAFAPELGFGFSLESGVSWFINGRYNRSIESGGQPATAFIGLNIGVAYTY